MTGPRLAVALALLVGGEAAAAQPPAGGAAPPAAPPSFESLLPVPEPPAGQLSDADREQLAAQQAAVAAARAALAAAASSAAADPSAASDPADPTDPTGAQATAALAFAYGRLGQLLYLYDFLGAAQPAFENASALAPEQFALHYYLGTIAAADGRLDEARGRFERALALQPDDLAARLRLGQLLHGLGEPAAARAAFAAALERDPALAAAHDGLGRVAAAEEDAEEAVRRFSRALELQPTATSIHHRLGLAYRSLGDLERAREHLAANRGDSVLFPDPLVDGLSRLMQGADLYLKAGNAAMERGDLAAALAHYSQAAEIDPEEPQAQYNVGFVLLQQGERERALPHLGRAVELDPEFRNAHFNLATALAAGGDLEGAATHYRRAYEIDSEDHLAHLEWAAALAATGRAEEAERELAAVLAAAPEYAREVRARATLELGRLLARGGRYAVAAERLGEAIALRPDDAEIRFARAMALLLAGDEAGARTALEADVRVLPEAVPLVHLLARLLATGTDPAVRDGRRAVDLALGVFRAAETVPHAETVAMAWAESGELTRAINWQTEAVAVAERTGQSALLPAARERLARYRRGEPVRAPWREGDGTGAGAR